MEVTIQATSGTKDTLDQLSNMIQKRAELLHQTTQQSVTAITIQTIKSLRADTIKSKGKAQNVSENAQGDFGITVKEIPNLTVGFKTVGKVKKPCIRNGKRGEIVNLRVWWKVPKTKVRYDAKVYSVTLSDNRLEAWPRQKKVSYMVASSLKSAIEITKKRYSKLASRYAGLSKDAWSRAMMMVSDRPANFISSEKAKSVLTSKVEITKEIITSNYTSSEGHYSITVEDTLRYAEKAQKSGAGAVTLAMQKACNSTAGYINKMFEKNGNGFFDSDKSIKIPFPPETMGE